MPKPLSPDALSELERLLAEATPGRKFATLDDDNHHDNRVCVSGREDEDYCVDCLLFTQTPADAAYLAALLNAAPELLRAYRAAQGGLAARMERETRIISLEAELAKARVTRDPAFESEIAFLCDLSTALGLPFETVQKSDVLAAIKRLRGGGDG